MLWIREKNFANLGHVGLGVGVNLLAREHFARLIPAGGIANAGGVVADDEHGLVAPILKLADHFEWDGMAEGDVGGGGVHAEFDAERLSGGGAALKFSAEVILAEDTLAAAGEDFDLLVDGHARGGILEMGGDGFNERRD